MDTKWKSINCRYFLILFLISALILTACSGTGKGSEGESEGNGSGEEKAAYMIRETDIPDPDEAMAELKKENDVIWELDYQLRGDKLYRLVQLWITEEGSEKVQHYLQVLDSPYETWKNYRIPGSYWDEAEEYEAYIPQEVIAVEEDKVYLQVRYWDGTCYLGVWSEDGSGGLLSVLPEEMKDMQNVKLVVGAGKVVGAYQESQNSFLLLDGEAEEAQIKSRISVQGRIVEVLQNPQSGELLWYGHDEDWKTGIWRVNDNAPAVRVPEGKGDISLAAYSDGGVLYLANDQELWRCDEKGEPESLFRFFDLDYTMEALYGMSVQAEDTLFLLARYEGRDHILQVTKAEGAVQEKKKIILAAPELSSQGSLRQAIAQFNRQNPEYRVEILEPENGESGFEFLDRIQKEMLAGGGGPDLFYVMLGKEEDFAENGYLQEVSDLLPEEGVLWQAALENGVIHGKQYGIPYECWLRFATYSRDLAGGRDSWILEEMMEAVRNSDVEVLQAGLSEWELVEEYGLYDNDNKNFIDWEKGESHLNEAPFLEFLAFVKEYADKEKHSGNTSTEPDTRLLEGKVAAVVDQLELRNLGDLNELEVRFQGKPAYIGYPRAEGNGIYVRSDNFYVSSRTEQREGCRAFLNFILSEEKQRDYVEYGVKNRGMTKLPVRLSALEYSIQAKRREEVPEYPTGYTSEGIPFNYEGLSEEQEAAFRFLLENARPANWYIMEVSSIVYEELQPYFAGQRTAEDAAGTLNRRIQIYLDERK